MPLIWNKWVMDGGDASLNVISPNYQPQEESASLPPVLTGDDDDAYMVVNEDEAASALFNMSNATVNANPEAEDENAVAAIAM